jgi:hypothetical protein
METLKEPSHPQLRPTTDPPWWTPGNASAWERVSAAFRRDWDQTKADFSVTRGRDLNQTGLDTIKQAAGKEALPGDNVKTHRDTPEHAAKLHGRVTAVQKRDGEKIAAAGAEIQHEKEQLREVIMETRDGEHEDKARRERKEQEMLARNRDAVAQVQDVEMKTLAQQDKKAAAEMQRADEKIDNARKATDRKVADEQEVIIKASAERDAALARWLEVEPAARYGFGARSHFPAPHTWNEKVEEKLRMEWTAIAGAVPWDKARNDVQRGWEYANKAAGSNGKHTSKH